MVVLTLFADLSDGRETDESRVKLGLEDAREFGGRVFWHVDSDRLAGDRGVGGGGAKVLCQGFGGGGGDNLGSGSSRFF